MLADDNVALDRWRQIIELGTVLMSDSRTRPTRIWHCQCPDDIDEMPPCNETTGVVTLKEVTTTHKGNFVSYGAS